MFAARLWRWSQLIVVGTLFLTAPPRAVAQEAAAKADGSKANADAKSEAVGSTITDMPEKMDSTSSESAPVSQPADPVPASQAAEPALDFGAIPGPKIVRPRLELDGLHLEGLVAGRDPITGKADNGSGIKKTVLDTVDTVRQFVTIGGYGQHEFLYGKDEIAAFRNHRFVLFISGRITDRITLSTEIEWEWAGSPMKRDGNLGHGEVLLEYAVVDVRIFDWLQFRAGVILIPTKFNLTHDAPLRQLVDRPIALTSILPSTWFESGAGFFGEIRLGKNQRMGYELYMVNGLDAGIQDGLGLRGARGAHLEDNNHDKAVTGRVWYRPLMGLEVGVFGYTGEYDKRHNRVNIFAFDITAKYKSFELLGEFVYAFIEEGFVEGFPASSTANTRQAVPEAMLGFYVQLNYTWRIAALNRMLPEAFNDSNFTLSLRYGGKDTDRNYDSARGDKRRLTLGINYRPVRQFAFKFNFQWNSSGEDGKRGAPELFSGGFWSDRTASFLPDRFVSSVAYQF
jgi:hypothetical protein